MILIVIVGSFFPFFLLFPGSGVSTEMLEPTGDVYRAFLRNPRPLFT